MFVEELTTEFLVADKERGRYQHGGQTSECGLQVFFDHRRLKSQHKHSRL